MRSALRQCQLRFDRWACARGVVLALAVLVSPLRGDQLPDPRTARLAEAFHDLTQYRFNQAAETFLQLAADPTWEGRRDALFGRAVALFNVQPQGPTRIEEARERLEQVRDAAPQDDLGIAARYFLGRILQVHQTPADPAAALAVWKQLVREHPEHYLGQMALVRWALLGAYQPVDLEQKRAIFRELEQLRIDWVDEHLRSLFHLVVADALMVVLQDPEWATRHYRQALADPEARQLMLTDALVRAGEAARRAGVDDVAIDAYSEFLRLSPRDPRAWLVRRQLAALTGDAHE